MSFLYYLTITILFWVTTATVAFTPYFTRKTECFGISIPEKEYENGTLMVYRKRFAVSSLLIGLLCFSAYILWYFLSKSTDFFAIFGILVQFIIEFFVYLRYHNLVKGFKDKSAWKNEVASSLTIDLTNDSKNYISSAWLLLFPVIIVATVLLGFAFYDKIPQQVPMHYDIAGNVNSYAQKSYGLIFFAPVMQLFMAVLFAFVFVMVKSRRRRIDSGNEEESRRKHNIFRRSMGIYAIVGGLLMQLVFALMQLNIIGLVSAMVSASVAIVTSVGLCIYAIVIGVIVGQGGSRVRSKKRSADKLTIKDADHFWKLGMFYVNTEDPAIFVEKRFGIGYTVNFGRPAAYLFLVGILLITVAIVVISNGLVK